MKYSQHFALIYLKFPFTETKIALSEHNLITSPLIERSFVSLCKYQVK